MSMVVTEVMERIGIYWPEAHVDAQKMADLTLAAHRLAGVENAGVPFCMTVEAEAIGSSVSLGSKDGEPRVVGYAMKRLSDVDRLSELDPDRSRAMVAIEAVRLLKEREPKVPIIANLTGPISLATSLLDPLVFYRALRRDKSGAAALLDAATSAAIVFGNRLLEAGADAVCIADPSATGEIIGRDAFEEFAMPRINKLAEHFRNQHGVPVIVHICGNVRSLGDSLADISAEVISVDSVVSITALKELAERKVLMGNISTYLLERGNAAQVMRAGLNRIRGGIDILAPACGISPRTPIANIRSLSDAAKAALDLKIWGEGANGIISAPALLDN